MIDLKRRGRMRSRASAERRREALACYHGFHCLTDSPGADALRAFSKLARLDHVICSKCELRICYR